MKEICSDLRSLKFGDVVSFVINQGGSYWVLLGYLVVEYVRPQDSYPAVNIIPWGLSILALASFLYFVEGNTIFPLESVDKIFLIFIAVVVLSSTTAIATSESFKEIKVIFVLLCVYFLIRGVVGTTNRFEIFILFWLLIHLKLSIFTTKEWLKRDLVFDRSLASAGMGWLKNPGEFGLEMCIFLSISIWFLLSLWRFWPWWKRFLFTLMPMTALSSIIASYSRATLLGCGGVVLWIILVSKHRLRILIVAFLLVLVLFYIPGVQKSIKRFHSAGEDQTSIYRLERWKKGLDMANRYPLLGVGYNNWAVADRKLFHGDGALSHNIFIQCMSELGYLGLSVYVILLILSFSVNRKTRKLVRAGRGIDDDFFINMSYGFDGAQIAYIVVGFFWTILYYPYFWITLGMTVALNRIAKDLPQDL